MFLDYFTSQQRQHYCHIHAFIIVVFISAPDITGIHKLSSDY